MADRAPSDGRSDATTEKTPTEAEPADLQRERRRARGSDVVSSAAMWSAGAGLVPVPVLDLAALAAIQVKMISDLAELYGQSLQREAVHATVSVLLGVLLPGHLATGVAASGAKFLPVVGTVSGAVSLCVFGAAGTYAVGKIFVRHFEQGGTMESFRPERVEDELRAEFRAARAKAR